MCFFYLILKLLALLSVTSLQTTALGVVKPVQSAPLTYTISVTTRGSGFHRSLQYNFGSTRDCQSLGDSAALSSGVAVLQPLPAGIFADVYQLQGAAAQGKGPDIKYFGFVDVESIELYGQPTILTSYHDVAPTLVWVSPCAFWHYIAEHCNGGQGFIEVISDLCRTQRASALQASCPSLFLYMLDTLWSRCPT